MESGLYRHGNTASINQQVATWSIIPTQSGQSAPPNIEIPHGIYVLGIDDFFSWNRLQFSRRSAVKSRLRRDGNISITSQSKVKANYWNQLERFRLSLNNVSSTRHLCLLQSFTPFISVNRDSICINTLNDSYLFLPCRLRLKFGPELFINNTRPDFNAPMLNPIHPCCRYSLSTYLDSQKSLHDRHQTIFFSVSGIISSILDISIVFSATVSLNEIGNPILTEWNILNKVNGFIIDSSP